MTRIYKLPPDGNEVKIAHLIENNIAHLSETDFQILCSNEETRLILLKVLDSKLFLPPEEPINDLKKQQIINLYPQNINYSYLLNTHGDEKRKKFIIENIKPSDDGDGIEFIKLGKKFSLFHLPIHDNENTFEGMYSDEKKNQMGIPGISYIKGNREGLREELQKQNKKLLAEVYPDYNNIDLLLYLPGDNRRWKFHSFLKLLVGPNKIGEIYADETINKWRYGNGGLWTGHTTGLDDGRGLSLEQDGLNLSLQWNRESTHAKPFIVIEDIKKDENKTK